MANSVSFQMAIKKPDILSGFFVFDALGITPVVPAFSVAVFSYSYLEHPALYVPINRKLMKNGIDAKYLNECAPKRTSMATFYPKSCPQKLGIV